MDNLTDVVEIYDSNHCVNRDGFIFTPITEPANIFDGIVIRNPIQCDCWSPKKSFSFHSLQEHIDLINKCKLEKAIIIAEDISFITQCPTLKYIEIIPADTAKKDFDYSPLYEMPELKFLLCKTQYGGCFEPYSTTIDYSQLNGLVDINIDGKGHLKYEKLQGIETINISGDNHENLEWLQMCHNLKKISFVKPKLKTFKGINHLSRLQQISIDNGRSLSDISALEYTSETLRSLSIVNCPKIEDFTFLESLCNLEHLELFGNNYLPNLKFLGSMKKLKTFCFSMNVLDCDLSPCMQVPYVNVSKWRKSYNIKNRQLPKQLPQKPFEIL